MNAVGLISKTKELFKKRKEDWLRFIGVFFLIYFAYSVFMNQCFQGDNLASDGHTKLLSLNEVINGGRYTNFLFQYISYAFDKIWGVTKLSNVWVLQILFIIFLSLSVNILYSVYSKYVNFKYKSIVLPCILSIAFINPYFTELFAWIGYDFGFGIILAVIAIKLFDKKKYIVSTIFLFLSISMYQSHIELFLIYVTVLIFINSPNLCGKKSLYEYIKMMLICGISAGLNIMISKVCLWIGVYSNDVKPVTLLSTSVDDGLHSGILNRLKFSFSCYYENVSYSFGTMPNHFLLFICGILIIISIFFMLKDHKITMAGYYLLIVIFLNIYTVAIYMISGYTMLLRTSWYTFAMVSMLFYIVLFIIDKQNYRWGISKGLYIAVSVVFLLVDSYSLSTTSTDVFIANKLDEQLAYEVNYEIKKYENSTGINIKNVSMKDSKEGNYISPLLILNHNSSCVSRLLRYDLYDANVKAFNYFTCEDYNIVEMTEEQYEGYFGDKEWESYDPEEQLEFIGDTLYWAVY